MSEAPSTKDELLPDEGKAPAAPRLALLRHVDVSDLAVLLKQRLQILGHSTGKDFRLMVFIMVSTF